MLKVHNKPLNNIGVGMDEFNEVYPTKRIESVDSSTKTKRKYVKKIKLEEKKLALDSAIEKHIQNFTAAKKVKKSKPKVSTKLLVVITLIISFLSNIYMVYSIYQAKHSYATEDTQTIPKKEVQDVR